jgi:hypothetical protein
MLLSSTRIIALLSAFLAVSAKPSSETQDHFTTLHLESRRSPRVVTPHLCPDNTTVSSNPLSAPHANVLNLIGIAILRIPPQLSYILLVLPIST